MFMPNFYFEVIKVFEMETNKWFSGMKKGEEMRYFQKGTMRGS